MRMPWPDRPAVTTEDLVACRALLRHGSKSFAAAARLLPRRMRDDATVLYAFCRVTDDAVDACGPRPAPIAQLRERLARAYDGRPFPQPTDTAFAALIAHHAIPRALPEALIEGFTWDAEGRSYDSLDDVEAYAVRVAGSVGVMMAVLMGVRDAARLARACDLGVAMQLTNIARDVGADARDGRLYLPRDWLRAEGIDPDAWLADPSFTPALGRVVRRLLDAADQLYARAACGVDRLPLACRPGIGAARRIYADIGRDIAAHGCDSVSRRAVVGRRRKLWLLSRSVAAAARSVWPAWPDASPPLATSRFLVDAVLAAPLPARLRDLARRGLDDRIIWVIELFQRLEQRDQLRRGDV